MRYDSTREFSVPSALCFDNTDKIPHFISTLLLTRSREKKVGFWCIEEIGDGQTDSCVHNVELALLNNPYFSTVVRAHHRMRRVRGLHRKFVVASFAPFALRV